MSGTWVRKYVFNKSQDIRIQVNILNVDLIIFSILSPSWLLQALQRQLTVSRVVGLQQSWKKQFRSRFHLLIWLGLAFGWTNLTDWLKITIFLMGADKLFSVKVGNLDQPAWSPSTQTGKNYRQPTSQISENFPQGCAVSENVTRLFNHPRFPPKLSFLWNQVAVNSLPPQLNTAALEPTL